METSIPVVSEEMINSIRNQINTLGFDVYMQEMDELISNKQPNIKNNLLVYIANMNNSLLSRGVSMEDAGHVVKNTLFLTFSIINSFYQQESCNQLRDIYGDLGDSEEPVEV